MLRRVIGRATPTQTFKQEIQMTANLLQPLQVGPLTLPRRIIVAPMCQYSAQDGNANEWHRVHLGTLARSGAGLVTVEATAPEPRGRITHNCLGLYSDANEQAFADILRSVRAISETALSIQVGHAGRKASTQRPWEGRGPLQLDENPWETLSPSGIPLGPNGPATREMSLEDMVEVRDAHVASARRALRLGFDALELHMGHGYLLSSFLSPLSNHRTDGYGGDLRSRLTYPLEIVEAIRTVWPSDRALCVKFNGTDWAEGGLVPQDAVTIAGALAEAGVDMVTLSGGGVTLDAAPPVAPGYQLDAARRVKQAGINVTVAVVGMIYSPHFAESILAEGAADAVSVARAFLHDPRWGYHAAEALGGSLDYPPQYERGGPAAWPPGRG
jgi:2,4-dienoyl-CoA reductase-like NADH-dependent reductase (Old Yellow Enzyme family)